MRKIIDSHYFKLVISSIFAGLIMALAGFELVAASAMNLFYLGGFIQGFGLLAILFLGLELYNNKFTSIFTSKEKGKTILDIFIVLVINLLTIVTVALLCRLLTNDNESLVKAAKDIAEKRIISIRGGTGKEWYDALIASLLCGFTVGVGVNVYRRSENHFIKFIAIIAAVGIYVACGFEQIMTNTFYVVFANLLTGPTAGATALELFIVLIGNTIACTLTYFGFKAITNKIDKKNKQK